MVYLSNAAESPWRKLFLVLLWVFQLALLPPYIIIIGLLVGIARSGDFGIAPLNVFNVVIEVAALFLICLEMTMYSYSELQPRTFLIFNIVKLLFGVISSGIGFYGVSSFDKSGAGLFTWVYLLAATILSVLICVSLFASLMYSIVVARRSTKKMKGLVSRYETMRPFGG